MAPAHAVAGLSGSASDGVGLGPSVVFWSGCHEIRLQVARYCWL